MPAFLFCLLALLALLFSPGCAEVTRPTPSRQEVEAVQLTALTRHPYATADQERAMRVFLRLLPTLPRVHGRTYPFLGFNWWITEAGGVAVDNVWAPSPARDRPLKRQVVTLSDPEDDRPPPADREPALQQGDLILAVNGMTIPTWVKDWHELIRSLRDIFHSSFPGEVLVEFVLAARSARLEAQGPYRGGPVTLLIDRQGVRRQVTLYPMHLPAQYGLVLVTGEAGNAMNIYAAPGQILLTRAMVEMCRTDDELAILLGHELAHQAHGHQVRRLGRYPVTGLVTQVIALPFRLLPGFTAGPPRQVAEDVRRVSGGALISVFSRQDELEADAYGLWYGFQAGFDVEQGSMIWERLAVVGQRQIFENTYFLDSHPAAPERLARLKKIARLFQAGQAAQVLLP